MIETKREVSSERFNKIFLDLRRKGRRLKSELDAEVEEKSASLFNLHIEQRLYDRSIKYYGITYSKFRGFTGVNCYNNLYTNLFITGNDGFFHVYIIPPK